MVSKQTSISQKKRKAEKSTRHKMIKAALLKTGQPLQQPTIVSLQLFSI